MLGIKEKTIKDISIQPLKQLNIPGVKNIEMPKIIMPINEMKYSTSKGNSEIDKIQFTGFLAQDVDKAAQSIGYDFSGVDNQVKLWDFVIATLLYLL